LYVHPESESQKPRDIASNATSYLPVPLEECPTNEEDHTVETTVLSAHISAEQLKFTPIHAFTPGIAKRHF
jgi:hypothetical protein